MTRKKSGISNSDSAGIHDSYKSSNNLSKQGQVKDSSIHELKNANTAQKNIELIDKNRYSFITNDPKTIENEEDHRYNNDLSKSDLKMRRAWEKTIQVRKYNPTTKTENNTICDENYPYEKEEDAIAHAMNVTTSVLFEEIEYLMALGMGAFQFADGATNERNKIKENLEMKTNEVNRLQESNAQSRQALSVSIKYHVQILYFPVFAMTF